MEIITSEKSKTYKLCKELLQKKYRDREGKYLVEGEKVVREAVTKDLVDLIILQEGYKGILDFKDKKIVFMKGKLFKGLSQTETSQGILAVVRKIETSIDSLRETLRESEGNVLVLENLQDPGNVGSLIRTATAAGYEAILMTKGTADCYSSKVARATAGALMRIPLLWMDSTEATILLTRELGKKIIGTSLDANKMYYQEDLSRNCAIVIGNEGSGITVELSKAADINVKIPMKNEIESLNAGVAGGILMYHSVEKG